MGLYLSLLSQMLWLANGAHAQDFLSYDEEILMPLLTGLSHSVVSTLKDRPR